MKLTNKKGFTLMEMLIVVAIIAILIAIAIPVFGAQLEKAREATDAANIRAAYAEVMVASIDSPTAVAGKSASLRQAKTGWTDASISAGLSALADGDIVTVTGLDQAGANKSWKVSYDGNGSVAITIG